MKLSPVWRERFHTITLVLIALTVVAVIYTLSQWIRSEPDSFEPLNVLAATILSALTAVSAWLGRQSDKTETAPPTPVARNLRNRENVLRNIYTTWIEGFLHQSLSHAIALELNLAYEPLAVARKFLQVSGQVDRPIPVERPIREVFEAHGRSLLILGDPGSGKTITLLQLAESLIEDAQNDPTQPIPMVLNLSSWAQQRPPLADWLVEEMFVQYQVARKLTSVWIEQNELLYLLDGLDEVAENVRDDCIKAINDFKAQHPAEIVVCSRTPDYEKLRNRLNLATAMRIETLTNEQIQTYLNQEGLEVQAVRVALNTDVALRELAHSPLFLSIMTLAYQGMSLAELKPLGSTEARRRHLFHTYVEHMFKRRPLSGNSRYDKDQALHWLSKLAYGMKQHNQSIFYIERLQPTWLSNTSDAVDYSRMVGLATTVATMSISIFVSSLLYSLVGIVFELDVGARDGFSLGFVLGIYVASTRGITAARQAKSNPVRLFEEVEWPSVTHLVKKVKAWLLVALNMVLLSSMIMGLVGLLIWGIDGLLVFGAFGGFIVIFTGVIVGIETQSQIHSIQYYLYPNQGIHNSFRSALKMGFTGMLFGVIAAIFGGFIWQLSVAKSDLTSLILPLIVVSFVWTLIHWLGKFGGHTVIQHYILRLLIARQAILHSDLRDSKLVAFLDTIVDHILLRRVGGGWVFIHRTFLEYFASLHPESDRRQETGNGSIRGA